MSAQECICYEIAETRSMLTGGEARPVLRFIDGETKTVKLLHHRTLLSLPMPKRKHTTERVSILLVGNRLIEQVANQTRPTPSPRYSGGWHGGHRRGCPFFVPPRPAVSKKRKRQALREARVESDLQVYGPRLDGPFGRRTPDPFGRRSPLQHRVRTANVTPALPRGAVKLMRERGFFMPVMIDRAWFTPTRSKPIKRREKRGQGKPR
jgi:hypothetical protein